MEREAQRFFPDLLNYSALERPAISLSCVPLHTLWVKDFSGDTLI
jgi:hypothetical protein